MGDQHNSWRACWTLVVLAILLIISKVECQQVTITVKPENVTAILGQALVLNCVFSESVACNWYRGGDVLLVEDEYSYTSQPSPDNKRLDCSLRISSISEHDFTKWRCSTYASKRRPATGTDDIWISKQVTPTEPVILFKNKAVPEIKLPNVDSPRQLVCISRRGNPPPELSWELNGAKYLGMVKNVVEGPDLYSVELSWDRMGEWQIFNNSNEIVCKATHLAYRAPKTTKVVFRRNYAPKMVKVWAEGSDGNEVQVSATDKVSLACISDGQPSPSYTWEVWSEKDQSWKLHNNEQNISVNIELIGKYRCKASNDLNNYSPTPSQNVLVVSEKKAEVTSTGVIIGIVIGCAFLVMIIILIIVYLKRKQKSASLDKAGQVAAQDGRDPEAVDETTEKTALSDPPYDQQNGGEDKLNGTTETSPIKVDQKVNQTPDEVVYAQLDLAQKDTAKVRTPSEPEKTEYAEIRFNPDQQNSHPTSNN